VAGGRLSTHSGSSYRYEADAERRGPAAARQRRPLQSLVVGPLAHKSYDPATN
jgi:hypothetical protein